jgi:predicted small lipoprotein YifL
MSRVVLITVLLVAAAGCGRKGPLYLPPPPEPAPQPAPVAAAADAAEDEPGPEAEE